MKRLWKILASAAALGLAAATPAVAQVKLANGTLLPERPFFIVTYIEAAPAEAQKVADLIKKHSAATRQKQGNIRSEALQENGRKNHFVVLEVWQDQAARAAHAKSDETIAFRKALHPLLHSPYDERPHAGLVVAGGGEPAGRGAVYVVTHVDIIPTEQFPPCKRQVSENGPCGIGLVQKLVADSRNHPGVLRFDALTQANRPNHMTVVEVWRSAKDQEAHTMHPDTRGFRDALAGVAPGAGVAADPLFVINPLSGSLYDEQLYVALD
jgi:quinol monooxygenase YgiN